MRASAWELLAGLLGSLLIIPVAFFGAVMGASDEWSESKFYASLIAVPLVAWGVAVVVLVYYWRGGWRRIWTIPLVVVTGFVFVFALLLLISPNIRRSVLPYKPPSTEDEHRGASAPPLTS